jgi:FkbM family methyltransferase
VRLSPLQLRREIRQRLAREVHRRGVYRLGDQAFGAVERSLWLERYGIDLVLDVGANVGGYAGQLRERGYRGRIISVEPASQPYTALAARARRDPLWEAHRAAAGDRDGSVTLSVAADMTTSSVLTLTPEVVRSGGDGVRTVRKEEVELIRLERFTDAARRARRSWMKLDVEGSENAAISGAGTLMQQVDCVEVEMATRAQFVGECLYFDVSRTLYGLGFELRAVNSAVTDSTGRTVRFDGLFVRQAL